MIRVQIGDTAGSSAMVALLAMAVGLAVALAWGLVSRYQKKVLARELQQSRADGQGLAQLLDVWQWRTNADHRLISLVPPQGTTHWAPGPLADHPLLWQYFASDELTSQCLQESLHHHAPIRGLRLHQGPERQGHCVLNAMAMLDGQGRFNGYLGTAREEPDMPSALVHELFNDSPAPMLRITARGHGSMPILSGSNPAASIWLKDAPPGEIALLELLHRLPTALRSSVEKIVTQQGQAPGEPLDGWLIRAHQVSQRQPANGTEWMMIFYRTNSNDAPGAGALDDQASFSYTISHDLRAPIRVVEGFTKIVKEDYGPLLDRIGNDHLDRVLGAAARMNSMIDALLTLSQLSSRPLARQPVNLSQLAGYIIDDLRRQAPERQVQVEIEPGLQAHGDATLLRVVLENLLGNAWKYTQKCRLARIWFERSDHEGRPAITVRDNGAGFDMRFADRLFGVFQRLHSANDFQGTGVGLASVRRIIRRHGGDIWAEGEVDRGARFQFWLGPSK